MSVQSSSPDSDVDVATKFAKIDKPEIDDKPVAGRNRKFKNGKAGSEGIKADVLEADKTSTLLDTDKKIDSEEADSEVTKTDTEKVDSEAAEVLADEEMSVDNDETVSEEETKMVVSESEKVDDSQKISAVIVDTSTTPQLVDESELNVSNEIVDQIVADIVNGIKMVDNGDVAMVDTKVEETINKSSNVDDIEITDKDVCEEEKVESEALDDVPVAFGEESEDSQTTEIEPQSSIIDEARDEELKRSTSSEDLNVTGKR